MAHSVKFAVDAFVSEARAQAELQSRSLAGQITHWARIGRAIERSGHFDHVKLSRVLAGELDISVLTAEERAVWKERFLAKMAEPGPDEEAFFEELRNSGNSVGVDETGRIVYGDGRAVD